MHEGLDRHDALHALGSALTRYLHTMLTQQVMYDAAAYERDLHALNARSWRASADG